MSTEDRPQDNGQTENERNAEAPSQGATGATPAERLVGAAREQASEAAGAFRRGEFIRDPVIDAEASSDDRLIAMLAYASQIIIPFVMPIIILVSESSKKRPFQRYHAVQSLALALVLVGVVVIGFVGIGILSLSPIIGAIFQALGVLLCCLLPIYLILVVMSLGFYGYQAYQGKRFSIPGLTTFLRDQGWLT